MPPPAKPNLDKSIQGPLQQLRNGQQSSPYFLRTTQDGNTKIEVQAGKKRGLESDDRASTPATYPKQAITADKRQNEDCRANNNIPSETNKKPAKSLAKQVLGGNHETLLQFESSQRTQSTDTDYEERRLHDMVSRERGGKRLQICEKLRTTR